MYVVRQKNQFNEEKTKQKYILTIYSYSVNYKNLLMIKFPGLLLLFS